MFMLIFCMNILGSFKGMKNHSVKGQVCQNDVKWGYCRGPDVPGVATPKFGC